MLLSIADPYVIVVFGEYRQKGNQNTAPPSDYALVTELCEGKPLPDAPKGVTPSVAAPQSHNHTTCMLRKMAGAEHQILYHRPQSPAANFPLGWLLVLEGFLTNHPEEIESNHCQFQHQGIGDKLPGRKTFHIHVGFQFAVVLLTFPMSMVGGDDIIVRPAQIGPEHIQLNIREHEDLAVFVNGALNDFVDDPHSHCLRFPGTGLV